MKKSESGTILLIFICFITIFVACTVCVVNLYSIVSEKQYLRNICDQAALVGTNEIDFKNYYLQGATQEINLDNHAAEVRITEYIETQIPINQISKINILIVDNEVSILLEKKSNLPFNLGIDGVKISAFASAKLVLD
jgi:hypothetical protein